MMGAIVLSHRWLGIAFCLLFAMWFASGIVMHFVPFPSLTEAERFAGLAPLDRDKTISVADAVAASGITDGTRVRLIQRSDGPVYVVSGPAGSRAVRASDRGDASVTSADVALTIVQGYSRQRGLDAPAPRSSLGRTTINGACRTVLIAIAPCFAPLSAMPLERRSTFRR